MCACVCYVRVCYVFVCARVCECVYACMRVRTPDPITGKSPVARCPGYVADVLVTAIFNTYVRCPVICTSIIIIITQVLLATQLSWIDITIGYN